ncbi:MAG: hypothetical protein PHS30_09410, partial [Bacteroidales bacterium]|nr:hypothetical protein [Bacteroidales bacterium]
MKNTASSFIYRLLFVITLFILSSNVLAEKKLEKQGVIENQSSVPIRLSSYVNRVAQFGKTLPQEKVYMQFDNTSYYAGETVYYKAWVVRAENNLFTDLSKVLYVELLSSGGEVISSNKLKIQNGRCHGSLILADTLKAADYRIRAYTKWQQNFSTENMFTQVIPVYSSGKGFNLNFNRKFKYGVETDTLNLQLALTNDEKSPLADTDIKIHFQTGLKGKTFDVKTDKEGMADIQYLPQAKNRKKNIYITVSYIKGKVTKTEELTIPLLPEALTVDFLPEGGDCVEGLENRIAFKAVDESGQNVDVFGSVYENDKTFVTSFMSLHQGMGSFMLTPKPGCSYSVKVKSAIRDMGGKTWVFKLPAAQNKGYVMQCIPVEQQAFSFKIRRSKGVPNDSLGFLIQYGGRPYAFNKFMFDKDSLLIVYPYDKMHAGINQVTLFNVKGEPLLERLVFVQHNGEALSLDVNTNKTSYASHERIQASIGAQDPAGAPVTGEFALAVRDVTKENNRSVYGDNLINSLLLTSDLKGPIRNPGYYILPKNEPAVDLLLLTQGWRRYVWKQQTGQETFQLDYQVESGLVIKGSVVSVLTRKPLPNYEITMLLHLGSGLNGDVCRTDKDGNFSFVTDFTGKRDLQLQSRKKTKNNVTRIMLDRDAAPAGSVLYSPAQIWNTFKKADKVLPHVAPFPNGNKTLARVEGALDTILKLKEVEVVAKKTVEDDKKHAVYSFSAEKVRDDARDKGERRFAYDLRAGLIQMLEASSKSFNVGLDGQLYYNGRTTVIVNGSIKNKMNMEEETTRMEEYRYSSDDIENVVVVDDPEFILGDYGAKIVYYLYADGKTRREAIGLRNTTFEGYSLVKEFFSPDYSVSGNIPDTERRRTLYWNPSVKTNAEGRAQVLFFNNDSARQYEFTVEG